MILEPAHKEASPTGKPHIASVAKRLWIARGTCSNFA